MADNFTCPESGIARWRRNFSADSFAVCFFLLKLRRRKGKSPPRSDFEVYYISWDIETGGVVLRPHKADGTLGVAPRPVFWEELDLLRLAELGWAYPRAEAPLLWAVNKQYWYRGEMVFEAKGANIYNEARVVFAPGRERMELEPVDMGAMLRRNADAMFLLESEALEFIRDTYLQYADARKGAALAAGVDFEALRRGAEKRARRKMAIVKEGCDSFDIMPLDVAESQGRKTYHTTRVDRFIASFSGGKDSQVVLDLCARAIPPSAFEVVYADTGYELPTSLRLYEQTRLRYQALFPGLRFALARNHSDVLSYWDRLGTPSDTHRWCCSVMKTAPIYQMFKTEDGRQAKVLTFEGVRAEESMRRSNYSRIGKGVKHDTAINARPIFYWSLVEVFLYLWNHGIQINEAYRQGLTRAGCLICPFGNEWNEMIVSRRYKENLAPFLSRIEAQARKSGVKDVEKYVGEGGWKRRGSGDWVDKEGYLDVVSTAPTFKAKIVKPSIPIDSFLRTLGEYGLVEKGSVGIGYIKIKDTVHDVAIRKVGGGKQYVEIDGVCDSELSKSIRRTLLKGTFCVHCGACEVECPTGALTVFPKVSIDAAKCISCHKCLDFYEYGCVAANSLNSTNGAKMNKVNIDRYKNFGLREEWMVGYLRGRDDYWDGAHGLNPNYQVPALRAWLKDAEIVGQGNAITALGSIVADNMDTHPLLPWEIAWTNLSHNSFIVNWYCANIGKGAPLSPKGMEEMILNQYGDYKAKTVHNAVYQLVRTLKESPIGKVLHQFEASGKAMFSRGGHEDLSCEALAYSVYKYAAAKGVRNLRVSDFYSEGASQGPAKEFAIQRQTFERLLRSLNSAPNRVLVAELNMGLDSITLRDDLTPLTCLEALLAQ